jgi:tetratricopeptide (TPR) repeat protein
MMIRLQKFAMHISAIRVLVLLCLAFSFTIYSGSATAQQATSNQPLKLIVWYGPGEIALPNGPNWELKLLTVYDERSRPSAQFRNVDAGLDVSYQIMQDPHGNHTSEACRDDSINPILAFDQKRGTPAINRVDGVVKNVAGELLVTTSYQIDLKQPGIHYHDLYGFMGNAKTCAFIHISGEAGTASEEAAMNALLVGFQPDLNYKPTSEDYFKLATALFKNSPGLAVPYYDSSLKAMPHDASTLTQWRIETDQFLVALGVSGDIRNLRAYAEDAIKSDPDYPMNYYNLACADAEQGKAKDARKHLQQAFDLRANVLKGESMPDPTQDEPILKLKKDKDFWNFVLALPRK